MSPFPETNDLHVITCITQNFHTYKTDYIKIILNIRKDLTFIMRI